MLRATAAARRGDAGAAVFVAYLPLVSPELRRPATNVVVIERRSVWIDAYELYDDAGSRDWKASS